MKAPFKPSELDPRDGKVSRIEGQRKHRRCWRRFSDLLATITSENVTLEGFTFSGDESDSFDPGAVLVLADECKLLNNTTQTLFMYIVIHNNGGGIYIF